MIMRDRVILRITMASRAAVAFEGLQGRRLACEDMSQFLYVSFRCVEALNIAKGVREILVPTEGRALKDSSRSFGMTFPHVIARPPK